MRLNKTTTIAVLFHLSQINSIEKRKITKSPAIMGIPSFNDHPINGKNEYLMV